MTGDVRRNPQKVIGQLLDNPTAMATLHDPNFVAVDVRCRGPKHHRIARFFRLTSTAAGLEPTAAVWFTRHPGGQQCSVHQGSATFVHRCRGWDEPPYERTLTIPVSRQRLDAILADMWREGARDIQDVVW